MKQTALILLLIFSVKSFGQESPPAIQASYGNIIPAYTPPLTGAVKIGDGVVYVENETGETAWADTNTYSVLASSFFLRMDTMPSIDDKLMYQMDYDSLDYYNIYDSSEYIYFFSTRKNKYAELNLISSSYNAIPGNISGVNPVFVPDSGYKFNGASSYLNTQFTPSTNIDKFKLNDASFSFYCLDNATGNSCHGVHIGYRLHISPSDGTNVIFAMNSSSSSRSNTITRGLTSCAIYGGVQKYYKNGDSLNSISKAPTGLPTGAVWYGARHLSTGADLWASNLLAFGHLGSSLSTLQQKKMYEISKRHIDHMTAKPLYILIGTSNLGRSRWSAISSDSSSYDGIFTGVKIFNPAHDTAWNPLQIGVNTRLIDFSNADEFGMESAFAINLQDTSNSNVYILKYGYGGSLLDSSYSTKTKVWYPKSNSILWNNFIAMLDTAFRQAEAGGIKLRIAGIILQLGENDATSSTRSNKFGGFLETFADSLENRLKKMCVNYSHSYTQPLWVANRMSENITTVNYISTINTALASFCTGRHSVLLNTNAWTLTDGVHYNAAGQLGIGNDLYEIFRRRLIPLVQ